MERADKKTSTTSQKEEKEEHKDVQEEQKTGQSLPDEWTIDAHYMRVYM